MSEMSSKLEQVLEYLVNGEQDKASALLHDVIVEKARDIHEELINTQTAESTTEEVTSEAKHDKEDKEMKKESAVEEATDEVKEEAVEEKTESTKEEAVEELSLIHI